LQWYFRNKTYFEKYLESDPRVLLVNYDALVSEPDRSLNAVLDFVGLAYKRRAPPRCGRADRHRVYDSPKVTVRRVDGCQTQSLKRRVMDIE